MAIPFAAAAAATAKGFASLTLKEVLVSAAKELPSAAGAEFSKQQIAEKLAGTQTSELTLLSQQDAFRAGETGARELGAEETPQNAKSELGEKLGTPENISERNGGEVMRLEEKLESQQQEITAIRENLESLKNEISPGWENVKGEDGRFYFNSSSPAAKLLNGDLPKNSEIVYDNEIGKNTITYKTDDMGRVSETSVDRLTHADGIRDSNQQQLCRKLKDGLPGDDAGHIIAREFGGPSEQINLTPMNADINRHGEWRKMEREIDSAINDGKEVTNYNCKEYFDGESKRPTGFDVSYEIDGELHQKYIDNTPRGL